MVLVSLVIYKNVAMLSSFFEGDYLKEFIKKSHQEEMNNKLFKPLVLTKPLVKLEKIHYNVKILSGDELSTDTHLEVDSII